MNHSAYIFGNFELGYSQYPDDYTKSILQDPLFLPKAKTQIAIHKDGNLIYYAYYRTLNKGKYIGLALVFNSVFFRDIKKLFNLFEDAITGMAVSGKIIEFDDSGELKPIATKLYLDKTEVDHVVQVLALSVNQLSPSDFKPLPSDNLSIDRTAVITISQDDFNKKSASFLSSHNKLLILKGVGYDSAQLSGYAKRLNALHEEIVKLNEENDKLKQLNEKLNKQKKQVTKVVFLVIALSLCIIGLLVFRSNVQRLNGEIVELKSEISELSETVDSQNMRIDSLQSLSTARLATIHSMNTQIDDLNETIDRKDISIDSLSSTLSNFRSSIAKNYPLTIKYIEVANLYKGGKVQTEYGNTIYSNYTMYLAPRIKYEGNLSGTVTLKVKLYKDGKLSEGNNSGYSYSVEEYIYTGDHFLTLSGWGNENMGNWSAGTYRFEIWHDDVCLKAKSFTIY